MVQVLPGFEFEQRACDVESLLHLGRDGACLFSIRAADQEQRLVAILVVVLVGYYGPDRFFVEPPELRHPDFAVQLRVRQLDVFGDHAPSFRATAMLVFSSSHMMRATSSVTSAIFVWFEYAYWNSTQRDPGPLLI
jgi:hypothetical protein